MNSYNETNAHPRDIRVSFDPDSHTYHVRTSGGDSIVCDSVTTIVDECFERFDADYWAERKATPTVTAEMLKAEWEAKGKAARDLGTQLHDRIERHYLGENPDAAALADPAFRNFLAFAEVWKLSPFRSEWRIYSERYRIAGTLDFLAYDGCEFDIFDWKRSSKLVDCFTGQPLYENQWGKRAFAPVSHLHDTTYWHYALQVSLYRYLLELEYGIHVRKGYLGTFHPDYTRPYVLEMPYLRNEVMAILNSRIF